MEVTDMKEEDLRKTKRSEIDIYFNERIYDSPVFKLSERFVKVEEEIKHNGERIDDFIHQMERRSEQVDKRFDDMNKKFSMQFTFMSLGFTLLAVLMTVYQFVN